MNKTKPIVLLCLAMSVLMMLAACQPATPAPAASPEAPASPAQSAQPQEPVAPAPEQGRTLVVGMDSEPTTLNAHSNAENKVLQVGHLVHGFLTALNQENGGAIQPAIVSSWDYRSETELTLNLRDDVYFHNGRQLTADDIVFTFNWTLDEANGSIRRNNFASFIESVEKTGEYQVLIKMSSPNPALLELMAFLPIVAEDTVDTLDTNPVGCGPFKFVSWERNQMISLEKFDEYYDAGSIQYTALNLRCFQDYNAEMTAFLAGEVDVFLWLSNVDIPTITARPDDFYVQSINDYAYYLSCNTAVESLQNPKVREAIQYAINKPAAINMVLGGNGSPVSQVVATTNDYYNPELDWEFDLERAKQALIDAGYPNGLELVLSTQNTVVLRDLATVMKEQLEAAGFKITLNVVESAAMFELWNGGGAELALGGFGFYNDPSFRSMFLSSTANSNWRRYGYDNQEYNELYQQGMETTDLAQRKAVYAKMWQKSIDEAGFFMIFSSTGNCAAKSNIEGLVYRSSGNSDFTHITFKD